MRALSVKIRGIDVLDWDDMDLDGCVEAEG